MIGHLWNNVYYATSIGTASVLNVLLLTKQWQVGNGLFVSSAWVRQNALNETVRDCKKRECNEIENCGLSLFMILIFFGERVYEMEKFVCRKPSYFKELLKL